MRVSYLNDSSVSVLSHDVVRDIVDIYVMPDPALSEVRVTVMDSLPTSPNVRGLYVGATRAITLFTRAIRESFSEGAPLGGNTTVAPTLEIAHALVLRHEIQHLNQHSLSGDVRQGSLGAGPYFGRPAEVDARRAAQESFGDLCRMFGHTPSECRRESGDRTLQEVLTGLAADMERTRREALSVADLRDILRVEGMNDPQSFVWMRRALSRMDITVR